MTKISDLSDELLVKILSFLPTKVAVSTSILSKQWEFLWMCLSDLQFDCTDNSVRDFLDKNLPLHRAPIYGLRLSVHKDSFLPEDLKSWIEIVVSRGVRELSISYDAYAYDSDKKHAVFLFLPRSLYTCNTLITLELEGMMILVDVPQMVRLPSLKTLHLTEVTYSNKDALGLLLSRCPVLEDLIIVRTEEDNLEALVIIVPSLQRLTLIVGGDCSSDGCEIVTPSLKYFRLDDRRIDDGRIDMSYLIEYMPELEEAYISVVQDIDKLSLKSITTVKRLTVRLICNITAERHYGDGIVFGQLENLKIYIRSNNWSKLLLQLLNDSPNLQNLDLEVDNFYESFDEYERVFWSNEQSSVPKCVLNSLKTLRFEGYSRKKEERDLLGFILKHGRSLKTTSILG